MNWLRWWLRSLSADAPLTAGQRAIVADFAAAYDPVRVCYGLFPGTRRAARAAGLTEDDVRSAGWAGVLRAARTFDPGRGVKFATYATPWIRNAVQREAEAVARGCLRGAWRPDDLQGWGWDDLGVAAPAADPDAAEGRAALSARVAAALGRLDARGREVLTLRFGIGGGPGLTRRQVGERLGVSRERALQMERAALAEVRVPLLAAWSGLAGGGA
jgi:RNA polymerase sporulation-specific sigma factor